MASGVSNFIYTLSISDNYYKGLWTVTNNLYSGTYVYWNTIHGVVFEKASIFADINC
jgi:hypothetical protein